MNENKKPTEVPGALSPVPDEETAARERRLAEVRRRLLAGELDSSLALVETAHALLDGDQPRLGARKPR